MITVKADAGKLILADEQAIDAAIEDGNNNPFSYMADAIAAVSFIVAHAETEYGPLITDTLLATLESGKFREAIEIERVGETADVQHSDEDGQSN